MSRKTRRGGLVGPILLIGIGVVFLLNSLGVTALSVWDLVQLWPLILIAIGVDLLIPRTTAWGSLLSLVLILAVFGGGYYLLGAQIGSRPSGDAIRETLGEAARAEVAIGPAVGYLTIDALSQGANALIEGQIWPVRGERVSDEYQANRDPVVYRLRSERPGFYPSTFLGGGNPTWELGLNPDVVMALDVSLGAGKSDLNLSGLTLSRLEMSMGVGQVIVTLPGEGRMEAKVDSAIGEMIVRIPEGMAARIRIDTGLATSSVPSSFTRRGDYYESSGYSSAQNRVELEIGQAIGVVRVEVVGR